MSYLEKLPEGDGGAAILVSTAAVNRLIDKMNALISLTISPQGIGSFKVGDKNAVLDLTGIRDYIQSQIQSSQNGGAGGGAGGGGGSGGGSGGQPPGGGGGPGGGEPPGFKEWFNNSVQGEVVCNGDGSATLKLRI